MVYETVAHVFNTCPKYRPAMTRRHNNAAAIILTAVRSARNNNGGGPVAPAAVTIQTESSLGWLTDNRLDHPTKKEYYKRATGLDNDPCLLRPDAYVLDAQQCTVTPVEFTIPDDTNIKDAIRRKHSKYDIPLKMCADAGVVHNYRLMPLAVIAIGTWGSTTPTVTNSLIRLGIPPEAIEPLLRRVCKANMRHNDIIARNRFAVRSRFLATLPEA